VCVRLVAEGFVLRARPSLIVLGVPEGCFVFTEDDTGVGLERHVVVSSRASIPLRASGRLTIQSIAAVWKGTVSV